MLGRLGLDPFDIMLAGRLGLRAFGAFLTRCDALLGTDSGPRHIANAVGTPASVALLPEPEGLHVAAESIEVRIVPLAPTVTILPLAPVATASRSTAVPDTRGVVVPEGELIPKSEESYNHTARVCRVGPDNKLYIQLGQPYNVPA